MFPRVFQSLTIKPLDRNNLWKIDSVYFDRARIALVPEVLAAVRELRISAPLEDKSYLLENHGRPCGHHDQDWMAHPFIDSADLKSDMSTLLSKYDPTIKAWENAFDENRLCNTRMGDYGLIGLAKGMEILLSSISDDQLTSVT